MNFKVFISVNIHTVALSWSSREREHPAPAVRSMLHLVWDTRDKMMKKITTNKRKGNCATRWLYKLVISLFHRRGFHNISLKMEE
jgi:hypothetical protein